MNSKKSKAELKTEALLHQLKLIEGVNEELSMVKGMNSEVLVKQALHLKKEFTKELLRILEEYELPIQLAEAA